MTTDDQWRGGLAPDTAVPDLRAELGTLLRAVVQADHEAFSAAQDRLLPACRAHHSQRDAMVRALEDVLRSAWAQAIAQGSISQRGLLMAMLGLRSDLKGSAFAVPPLAWQQAIERPPGGATSAPLRRATGRQIDWISQREREVIQAVADGLTNKQIAQRLSLSPNTVKRHMTRVMHRLGLRTRSALAVWFSAGSMADTEHGLRPHQEHGPRSITQPSRLDH